MSDGEQLMLILSLIYLSGCFIWVDRRIVLFCSWFGGKWSAIVNDYRWGNSSGRPYLLNPFPPLGCLFAPQLLSVSVSPKFIVAYNLQSVGNSGRPRHTRKIAQITAETHFARNGAQLVVNGKNFCDVGDLATVHKLVILLNAIKWLEEPDREKKIREYWHDRLNLGKTRKYVHKMIADCQSLRFRCTFSVVLFFVVFPLLSLRFGVGFAVLLGAVTMLLAAALICKSYYSLHRRYYPIFKGELLGDMFRMMLCPPTAFRACDGSMRKLSARLDILPMAMLLLRGEARTEFMNEYIANLETPDIPEGLPEDIRETCLWQNRMILDVGNKIVRRINMISRSEGPGAIVETEKHEKERKS